MSDHDDPVNHPAHYNRGGIEVIDAIEAWGLEFCLGNAVKSTSRVLRTRAEAQGSKT